MLRLVMLRRSLLPNCLQAFVEILEAFEAGVVPGLGVLIGCIYLPNGNPQPGPKFDYKLAWFERLIKHARSLKRAGVPAVLAGDYNVVPTDFDIYERHSYGNDALLRPESRSAYARLLKQGWTDALRSVHPDERIYTYWSYLRHRWPNNKGLGLDHFLLSPEIAARLEG